MAIEFPKKQAEKQKSAIPRPRWLSLEKKITDKERMFFTEQLALLLETGSNLYNSLKILEKLVETPAMGRLINTMAEDVMDGKSFSYALAKHPKVFSQTFVNLITASEQGGYMHEVLEQLLHMDEKRDEFNATLSQALSYPIFLLVFALVVVIFVLVVVFPKFGDMFTMIQDQLPPTTKVFMATSEFFINQWPYILAGLSLFGFTLMSWIKSDSGRYRIDYFKLRIPGIRNIFIQMYMVQVMRVLSMSLSNGVGVMEALHACREVVSNRVFQNFIGDVEKKVEEGAGIAIGFRESDFIPSIVEQMITTGEETGNLAKVSGRLADFYEQKLSRQLTSLSKLAEPIMLVVMGGVVGLLVSSLILPIFKLSRAVG
ncbi:MAG: type II secretion system F family protein [Kangiellaceae bacterium]|nr:type II secretion system F family protein [Kangiellaceae bacterium]